MKKHLTLVVVFLAIVGLSSCTKEEIIQEIQINPNRTVWASIRASDWIADESLTDRWYVRIPVPEIDDLIMDHGTVMVDISFDNVIFEPMTTVYNGVAYRFDYSLGEIEVDARYADGLGGDLPRPGTADLKIILVDSESIN